MGKLIGSTGQYTGSEFLYDASGAIASGGTPQLILPKAISRSSLIIENISDTNMYFEFGAGRANASLTSGVVSSCSIANAGFGYSLPPKITFLGGQNLQQSMPAYTFPGSADYISPSHPAQAHCVMSGSAPNMTIGSIVIDDPGANYAHPPYVFIQNDPRDPWGCAAPSTTQGILLLAGGGSYTPNGTICTTDQVAVYCATTGKAFTCKYSV